VDKEGLTQCPEWLKNIVANLGENI